MILKVKFKSFQRNFSKYLNFCDIDVNNVLERKVRKFAYFLQQHLDLRPNSAKRGLISTISTVFNADILVLLTIILDVPFFKLFEAEI